MSKSIVANKSPLHPSALRLNDIQPGRRFIRFNRYFGIREKGTILTRPFIGCLGSKDYWFFSDRLYLVVKIRNEQGMTVNRPLIDMGIVPDGEKDNWSSAYFTIDARKEHLLPAPVPFQNGGWLDDEEEDFDPWGEY